MYKNIILIGERQIVKRESALLNVANEMPLPLDADHREICRFSNPNDPRYNVVILAMANLIKNIIVLGGMSLGKKAK
jgi:hypothetical protein